MTRNAKASIPQSKACSARSREKPVPSAISNHCATDGKSQWQSDFVKIAFAHHPISRWNDKCFIFIIGDSAFPLCSRCMGAVIGIVMGVIIGFSRGFDFNGLLAITLPMPAFLHWSFFRFSSMKEKIAGFATGILLGVSVPIYYAGAVMLKPEFFVFASVYLIIYILIMKRRTEKKNIEEEIIYH